MAKISSKLPIFCWMAVLILLARPNGYVAAAHSIADPSNFYNIKTYGAKGDGKTLDTDAVNKAIDTAATAGGGTVFFPAGTYLCFSIRLKSNITLYLDNGA